MTILSNALLFFLVSNPIGNTPAVLALVKDFPFERQKKILFREGVFSLLIALLAQYLGEYFLTLLQVQNFSLSITGGIILLIVALNMLFPQSTSEKTKPKHEPFIVPIATPLMTGAGIISIIMIKSKMADHAYELTASILIAFGAVIAVLSLAPYLQRLLGKRGLNALEQVMGMVLALVATEMIVQGGTLFAKSLKGDL